MLMFGLSVVGCAHRQSSNPRIYSSYWGASLTQLPKGFDPILVSGDGKAVIGALASDDGLWKWTENSGLEKLSAGTGGAQIFPVATDRTGDVIAGKFLKMSGYAGFFRWEAQSGLKLLIPPTQPAPRIIQLSEDGRTILFSCPSGPSHYPTCPGSESAPKIWPSPERIWTEKHGFQILGLHLPRPFDYIVSAGDFSSFLLGQNQTKTAPPNFGRLDSNGQYTAFSNPPGAFNADEYDSIIANNKMTVVAYQRSTGVKNLWNASGKPISLQLPKGCTHSFVEAIDNEGGIFVFAFCSSNNSSGEVGFRFSASGLQTISDWFRNKGLPNNLPLNTSIVGVSDNGKTLLGLANIQPPAIAGADKMFTPAILPAADVTSNDGAEISYFFLAHLP